MDDCGRDDWGRTFFGSIFFEIMLRDTPLFSEISLNFMNNALKDKYCSNLGRPAKEPEMLVRILIIQYISLSDEQVINEINVNLAFIEFIGIEPDEDVPCASLLGRVIDLGENTSECYEHNQWSKTEEFKEGYKKRAKIEQNNAELKRFHGLDRAGEYGLKSASTQTKLTIIAVNLKRICKLISASPAKSQAAIIVYSEMHLEIWGIQGVTARKQALLKWSLTVPLC